MKNIVVAGNCLAPINVAANSNNTISNVALSSMNVDLCGNGASILELTLNGNAVSNIPFSSVNSNNTISNVAVGVDLCGNGASILLPTAIVPNNSHPALTIVANINVTIKSFTTTPENSFGTISVGDNSILTLGTPVHTQHLVLGNGATVTPEENVVLVGEGV